MEIIINKRFIRGEKRTLLIITKQYEFCDDIWGNIKEFAGIYSDFPIELIDIQQKVGVIKLEDIVEELTHCKILRNAKSVQKRNFVLKCFYKHLQKIPKTRVIYHKELKIQTTQWGISSKYFVKQEILPNYTKIEMIKTLYEKIRPNKWTPPKDLKKGDEIYVPNQYYKNYSRHEYWGVVEKINKNSFTIKCFGFDHTPMAWCKNKFWQNENIDGGCLFYRNTDKVVIEGFYNEETHITKKHKKDELVI
jgi:hypothetical protein